MAMGPRHVTQGLGSLLADPLLSAVRAEAAEAAASGWFWNIRPLRSSVRSVTPRAGGTATLLATVGESADLWASNGKKGDSYRTSYQARGWMCRGARACVCVCWLGTEVVSLLDGTERRACGWIRHLSSSAGKGPRARAFNNNPPLPLLTPPPFGPCAPQVEYTVVPTGPGEWRISSALVLGS